MKRPIVVTRERAVAGETREKADFYDPMIAEDLTFVPGYSDKRRARDRALAEGRTPEPLPFRLQWVRSTSPNGRPDSRSMSEWRAKGYKAVHESDLAGLGLQMPIGAIPNADGTLQVGDTTLFIADGPTAARHEENWHRATEELQSTDAAPALQRAGREVGKPGEDLTFVTGTRVTDDRMAPPE